MEEGKEFWDTYVQGSVEAEIPVKRRDGGNLLLSKIEARHVQIRLQTTLGRTLGNDSKAALGSPPQQDLGSRLAMSTRHLLNNVVLEKSRDGLSKLHVPIDKGLGPERRVPRDCNLVVLRQLEDLGLHEVRVVLDLERLGHSFRVCEQI